MCHPDEWLRATTQAGIPTNESVARLALPICAGPKVLLGRVFDCSCFVMSGADSPVVAFLATASDGLQVTVRDAWLAIWQNMPWVSSQLHLLYTPPCYLKFGTDANALRCGACCSVTTST